MKPRTIVFILFVTFTCSNLFAQQAKAYDSTMKLGKAGYRVRCSNKKPDKNSITIGTIGFESNATRDFDTEINGRVNKAEVDDLNNDGFPDMLLYVINANDKNKGTVVGVSSINNERITAILFPDIMDDAKLRVGYNGEDEFRLLQGTLLRTFQVYDLTDKANPKPTGIYRNIQYRVVPAEREMLKFVVLRSYEVDKSKK
jgi:hypothetical protein